MSFQKLIDKYMGLQKKGFETMTIADVIKDLRNAQPIRRQI